MSPALKEKYSQKPGLLTTENLARMSHPPWSASFPLFFNFSMESFFLQYHLISPNVFSLLLILQNLGLLHRLFFQRLFTGFIHNGGILQSPLLLLFRLLHRVFLFKITFKIILLVVLWDWDRSEDKSGRAGQGIPPNWRGRVQREVGRGARRICLPEALRLKGARRLLFSVKVFSELLG